MERETQFSWEHLKSLADTEPVYFYGEMVGSVYLTVLRYNQYTLQVTPEVFDDFVNLRPLKGAAEILANDTSWGRLYDPQQLRKNEVKVSAITYACFLQSHEIF